MVSTDHSPTGPSPDGTTDRRTDPPAFPGAETLITQWATYAKGLVDGIPGMEPRDAIEEAILDADICNEVQRRVDDDTQAFLNTVSDHYGVASDHDPGTSQHYYEIVQAAVMKALARMGVAIPSCGVTMTPDEFREEVYDRAREEYGEEVAQFTRNNARSMGALGPVAVAREEDVFLDDDGVAVVTEAINYGYQAWAEVAG